MKLILQILLIFLVVSTVCICVKQPEMHKSFVVYNSEYKIVQEPETQSEVVNMPIMEQPAKMSPAKVTVEKKTVSEPFVQKQPQKTKTTTVKQTAKPVQTRTQTTTPTAPKQVVQTIKNEPVTIPVKTETTPKPVRQTVVKQDTQPAQTKVLTQQEEEIAWNIWRSNLQNKIMQDVRLPLIPNGVVFKFTFTVDKYGKISNVQTWATTPGYTPYAIQYIAPVIRSYQGRSILNFPEGSLRVTTNVSGGWKIADKSRYSSPQDYHDVEKIVK